MSRTIATAANLVSEWLHGEHTYQFDKNLQTHGAHPQASVEHIMGSEIINKWHQFRVFRDEYTKGHDASVHLQASQQLLKTTSAARGALVWDSMANGRTIRRASQASFAVLQSYLREVIEDPEKLPAPELLDSPLEEAIYPASTVPIEAQYQILPVFTTLAGHAINHLLEQASETQAMTLPRPGTPSGTVEPWRSLPIPSRPA
ncbi:MAG: hypothetical protein JWP13_219 [Candidatus Saccharibacteria bacterium]|nr:hypothetical protein [Candidatus Saccharibacteria bacterium]